MRARLTPTEEIALKGLDSIDKAALSKWGQYKSTSIRKHEFPPPGWFSSKQIAILWGVSKAHCCKKLLVMTKAGQCEMKTFHAEVKNSFTRKPFYRLTAK